MSASRELPILFSKPMVRAILDDEKTVTRRIVRFHRNGGGLIPIAGGTVIYLNDAAGLHWYPHSGSGPRPWPMERIGEACPYGGIGDRLWVREAFAADVPGCGHQGGYSYRADHIDPHGDGPTKLKFKPGIHMPRAASRITLFIVDVRVERLHAIDDADAIREGVMTTVGREVLGRERLPGWPRQLFGILWDEINGKRAAWASNPWVWRVQFERVRGR